MDKARKAKSKAMEIITVKCDHCQTEQKVKHYRLHIKCGKCGMLFVNSQHERFDHVRNLPTADLQAVRREIHELFD